MSISNLSSQYVSQSFQNLVQVDTTNGKIYTGYGVNVTGLDATASYATTAPLYLPLSGGTVSGNLNVLGTSSFSYSIITASFLAIGANSIMLNTFLPSARFGGVSVFDSGSTQRSGSILFDALNDQWVFVHQGTSTTPTSSLFIMGPESVSGIGNETNLTNNKIVKSVNAEHIGDSNITDTGTLVTINSSTTINNILTLTPRTTTPTLQPTGSIIMSSSAAGVKPFYFNGNTWNPFAQPTNLFFGHSSTTSYANGATYFYGQILDLAAITTNTLHRTTVNCPVSGFVTSGDMVYSNTAGPSGTPEFASIYVKNVTTNTTSLMCLAGFISGAPNTGAASGSLATPLPVSVGDKLSIQVVSPAWSVAPTSVRAYATINITTNV